MKSDTTWTVVVIALIILIIAAIYGWIENIIYIIQHHATMDIVIGALRIAGVFLIPLGGILGYIG